MTSAEQLNRPTDPHTPQAAAPSGDDARGTMIWRRKWWIVLFAIIVAGVVYGATSQLSPRYQASATVQVALLGGSATSEGVTAANDLASQYAQIVDADPVVDAVAQKLGEGRSAIRDNVSGSTINDQNLISVSARAGNAEQASRRAPAAAQALVTYVTKTVQKQSTSINDEAIAQLKPLDDQIRDLRRQTANASRSETRSQQYIASQQSLATLEAQRAAAIGDIARNGADGRPAIQVLNPAGDGSKVSPKPLLYAGAAFLVALLLAAQVASVAGARRRI
jgi:capsular polysaccharide biosynthesis protein